MSACLNAMCRSILSITAPSVMNEMIRIVPPQREHRSGSSCQTCRMSFAHRMRLVLSHSLSSPSGRFAGHPDVLCLPFDTLSMEYGNVFQTRDEIAFENGRAAGSAFLGLDTPLGPIYVAYGVAEGERGNYYFCLGKRL